MTMTMVIVMLTTMATVPGTMKIPAASASSLPLDATLSNIELANLPSTLAVFELQKSQDYFGGARVYKYPDPPGQSREELVQCFRDLRRGCNKKSNGRKGAAKLLHGVGCDPDNDGSPWASLLGDYMPENMGELFFLPEGNVYDVEAANIDLYIVNPCVVGACVCIASVVTVVAVVAVNARCCWRRLSESVLVAVAPAALARVRSRCFTMGCLLRFFLLCPAFQSVLVF